jgi:hypothetical protein
MHHSPSFVKVPQHKQDNGLVYFYGIFSHTSSSRASTTPIDALRCMLDAGIEKVAVLYWVPKYSGCSLTAHPPLHFFELKKTKKVYTVFTAAGPTYKRRSMDFI